MTDLASLKIDREIIPHRSNRRRVLWIIPFLIIGFCIVYWILPPSVPQVRVIAVQQVHATSAFLSASGYLVAERQAELAFKVPGRLAKLYIKEGDQVTKGTVIAQLEDADVISALSQAHANLAISKSQKEQAQAEEREVSLSLNRKRPLFEEGLLSKSEYDTIETRYRRAVAATASAESGIAAAIAAVNTADVAVRNTRLFAPFQGTILKKQAELGEVVEPATGRGIVTIADMNSLRVEADISESNIEKIRVGQPCEITLDAYPQRRYAGEIDKITPTADRAKGTIKVKISLRNRDPLMLPEMSARVAFLSDAKKESVSTVAVPANAIVMRGGSKVAFRVRDHHVEEIPVSVGGVIGNLVEIANGLSVGDRVVVDPSDKLNTGHLIRIKNE